MGTRWRHLTAELSKFAATGVVATLVALVLFNWLVHYSPGAAEPLLADRAITAYVVANTVGMVISYRMSRSWAFRHREPVGLASGRFSYFAINIVTMTVPASLLWVTRHVIGWDSALADNVSANVVGLSLSFVARFYLFRVYVFVHPDDVERPDEAEPQARGAQRSVHE